MDVSLKTQLSGLTRVGQTTAGRLKKLGLTTVEDLLFYFPYRYEDYSQIIKIKDLQPESKVTIQGTVTEIKNRVTRRRMSITSSTVEDDSGNIEIVWFNQPYLLTQLREGDSVSLSGKVESDGYKLMMKSPDWEKGDGGVHTGRLVPLYPLTAGLTQKQVRFLVSRALEAVDEIEEWMTDELKVQSEKFKVAIQSLKLLDIQSSISQIHFPDNHPQLSKARVRLKFEELFWLQMRKAVTRSLNQKLKAPKISFKEKEIKRFVDALPFKLTDAQRKTSWQILKDLERPIPMNRLLQGDVGSGKTVVAVMAMLSATLNGHQAVLMAPTEILAKQHFASISKMLEGFGVSIGLVTRSDKKFKVQNEKIKNTIKNSKMIEMVGSGEVNIIIGTHALIQDKVKFNKLGLVIVDEQHRFGVEQRKALRSKGSPHFLSMTATPIPRSLALTMYSDLDLSILDEMPKGRKPIQTRAVAPADRKKAYDFIRKQIEQGRQIFVICPLIDESDKLGVKAVTTEFEKLDKEVFPHLKIGLLHGKLKDKEKDEVQQKFVNKKYDILVATSVVEVGVDVPNASVMMIEGSDRFGLAQLHQFRGRVGRSEHQSYCFLFSDSNSQNVYARLEFLSKNTDGFKIAEFDMKIRGTGDMYGKQQSGLPEFKIASLTDYKLIELTQHLAREIVDKDSTLSSFPAIKKRFDELGGVVHLE